jgi:hypothetical protein
METTSPPQYRATGACSPPSCVTRTRIRTTPFSAWSSESPGPEPAYERDGNAPQITEHTVIRVSEIGVEGLGWLEEHISELPERQAANARTVLEEIERARRDAREQGWNLVVRNAADLLEKLRGTNTPSFGPGHCQAVHPDLACGRSSAYARLAPPMCQLRAQPPHRSADLAHPADTRNALEREDICAT